MSEAAEYVRLVGSERRDGATLAEVSRHWQGRRERFLFVSPHDDDAAIGAGLFIQRVQDEGVPVDVLIVTDGRMGYCSDEERATISDIRRAETFAAYQKLGVPQSNIAWMGFPDCQLTACQGRRLAGPDEAGAVAGYGGLQNALTHHLRRVRPTQCFVPTSADLHPDHRAVHSELMISIFHAAGAIWPELGQPLDGAPHVHEMAVYCNFPTPPRLRLRTPAELLETKLAALACFASQRQIASLLKQVAEAGPEEYFRPTDLALYHPSHYRAMFDEPRTLLT
jgi:LmbE family N-acetylglucosaminyl deacetylase